jgi:hypothetical protein
MANPVSTFFRDLRTFGKTLIIDSRELRASIDRNVEKETEVGTYSEFNYANGLLSQLKNEIYEAQEETDSLFSDPTDSISLEEMLKVCASLYENNQTHTVLLDERLHQYGYNNAGSSK